jgi:hypothetical protein
VLVSTRRNAVAARRFFTRALKMLTVKVVTDAAAAYPAALADLVPAAWHHVEQYAKNPVGADHSWPGHGSDCRATLEQPEYTMDIEQQQTCRSKGRHSSQPR